MTTTSVKKAENGKGFQEAEIRCETPGCRWEGRVCSTVVCEDDEWDAFLEGFGHGAESRVDYCVACGQLGILQGPR